MKARSLECKQLWVKELREVIQNFQFGTLRERTTSMTSSTSSVTTTASMKSREEKAADRESGVIEDDAISGDFDNLPEGKVLEYNDNVWSVTENYKAGNDEEISLKKGQLVEVLVKPHGSSRWRVRLLLSEGIHPSEGWVPHNALKRSDDRDAKKKRHSDISHSSSEDSVSLSSSDSPTTSWYQGQPANNNGGSPPVRRRSKSGPQLSLRKRSWSKIKMSNKPPTDQSPGTPTRTAKKATGGGSKKLQQLLGASESDIDLLLGRPAEIIHTPKSIPEELSDSHNGGDPEGTAYLPVQPSTSEGELKLHLTDDEEEEDDLEDDIDNDYDKTPEDDVAEAEEEQEEETQLPAEHDDPQQEEDVDQEEIQEEETEEQGVDIVPSTPAPDHEDPEAVALKKRTFVLKELIQTEKDYVKSLGEVVEGFIVELAKPETPEELKGKTRVLFGNIQQIYEWHKSKFLKELEKCEDAPEKLASCFLTSERYLKNYIFYCQNKPKSMNLVHEFRETYFGEVVERLGYRLGIEDYLIKPVQRIMKYQLLLKDFVKYTGKAGLDTTELKKALDMMYVVPKKANDMMNVGMLEGYTGKITAQGTLIMQDTLMVSDPETRKPCKRQVFLFEQLMIFSEPFERKLDWTVYIYRHSIKVNHMNYMEGVGDDQLSFAIWTGSDPDAEIFTMTASSAEKKKDWLQALQKMRESQRAFAIALERPIEYQKQQANGIPPALTPGGPVTTQGQVTPSSSTTLPLTTFATRGHSLSLPNAGSLKKASQIPVPSSQPSRLKHMNLIALETAQSLEDLTSPFSNTSRNKERFVVLEDFKSKDKDHLSVKKGEVVYLVSNKKHDKNWRYVCNFTEDKLGLVPAKILRKEANNNFEDSDTPMSPKKTAGTFSRKKVSRHESFTSDNKDRRTQKKQKDSYLNAFSNKIKQNIDKYRTELSTENDNDTEDIPFTSSNQKGNSEIIEQDLHESQTTLHAEDNL